MTLMTRIARRSGPWQVGYAIFPYRCVYGELLKKINSGYQCQTTARSRRHRQTPSEVLGGEVRSAEEEVERTESQRSIKRGGRALPLPGVVVLVSILSRRSVVTLSHHNPPL